jgi:hypothetical protein
MRPELTVADLFFKLYQNTFVGSKYNTIEIGVDTPAAQRYIKNNLFINCNSTIVSGGTGSNTSNNIALIGVTLANYFIDPVNKDFRLKAGASAIGAGVNLTAELIGDGAFHDGFKDYSGGVHANPPSVGAFENLAAVGNHYSFAQNGQSGGGGPVTPPPITIDAGPDLAFNLPQNSVTITAVKSDPARTLTNISWIQLNGPAAATISNGTTLTATFSNLVQGTYSFRIDTFDTYGQNSFDQVQVTVSPAGIVTRSTFQWYITSDTGANAPNLTTITPIAGANQKSFNPAAYVGQDRWFRRGETPVAKSGVLIGPESYSNWINVP